MMLRCSQRAFQRTEYRSRMSRPRHDKSLSTPRRSNHRTPPPSVSLTPRKTRRTTVPRTALTKQIRLEAHKMHLLTLLASFRNLSFLLSSPSLLSVLRPVVPPATVNALNAGIEHTPARRTVAFLSGLKDLMTDWHNSWKETSRGWRRPRWVDKEDLGKV
jgi:xeroderma pigmentosum group C-complementing protein